MAEGAKLADLPQTKGAPPPHVIRLGAKGILALYNCVRPSTISTMRSAHGGGKTAEKSVPVAVCVCVGFLWPTALRPGAGDFNLHKHVYVCMFNMRIGARNRFWTRRLVNNMQSNNLPTSYLKRSHGTARYVQRFYHVHLTHLS